MGRKTYDSIGFPLPKRRNIIVSHNTSFQAGLSKSFNKIILVKLRKVSVTFKFTFNLGDVEPINAWSLIYAAVLF
jgi:hypothetical protein